MSLFKFNISEMVHNKDIVTVEYYAIYRMMPFSIKVTTFFNVK